MKPITILVGDDAFEREINVKLALGSMFMQMAVAANHKEAFPIKMAFEDGDYVAKNVVPYSSEIRVRAVHSVDAVVAEAQKRPYDLVVTDMEYGDFGGDEGGVHVIERLPNSPVALCTSSSRKDLLQTLKDKVHIMAAPALEVDYCGTKFDLLGEKVSKYFAERSETK